MLGPKGRLILAELQRDSRLTNQELADKVGMSSSATWRRVKSLEEDGVIDRHAAIVNPKKAGTTHCGVPVFASANAAMDANGFDASVLFIPRTMTGANPLRLRFSTLPVPETGPR